MRFAFGDYLLDVERRELHRCAKRIALEPQVFDLLAYLVSHRDRVVGKDELVAHIWRGRMVSDSALMTRLNAARTAVGDSGASQRVIRTIPRKGVRFVAEVTEEASDIAALSLPDKPSIAVLPLQNMSGDAEQDYFADGMAEEITTALSRIRWLFVIARNSSFTYKGRAIDVRRVGRELGVRYVLEGSIRKSGDRVRITAQLIEAENGTHLWADRFDGRLEDVFELQDRVATSVAGAIEPKLLLAEIQRTGRKPTESLDAYDLYLRAFAQFHQYTEAGCAAAVVLAKKALALDPNYGRAAALVGLCRVAQAPQAWGSLSPEEIADSIRLAMLAIETGKDDPDALWMAAFTLALFSGDHATAMAWVDRALLLNPNAAYAWFTRGWVAAMKGQSDAAIEGFQRATRLSPFDPMGWMFSGGMAVAHLVAHRFEDVIDWADRTLRTQPRYSAMHRLKAIAHAHLDRLEKARECVRASMTLAPEYTISGWIKAYGDRAYSADTLAVYVDGLRKAGAPE